MLEQRLELAIDPMFTVIVGDPVGLTDGLAVGLAEGLAGGLELGLHVIPGFVGARVVGLEEGAGVSVFVGRAVEHAQSRPKDRQVVSGLPVSRHLSQACRNAGEFAV